MTSFLTRSIFLTALAHLTLELCGNFLPVLYPVLISRLDLSYAQIGLIALIGGTGPSLAQPLFGYLSDRWGSRRLTSLSIAWTGLTMGLVGFTWDYLSLVLLVGLGVIGSAAFHPAGATIALSDKSARPGAAAAIFSVSGNIGAALSPLYVAAGISWLGLPGTGLLVPVALGVSLWLHYQLVRLTPTARAHASQVGRPVGQTTALLGLSLIILVVMCRSWFQYTLMTYLPAWLQSQGQTVAAGGQMLFIFMLAVGLGSLTGGSLSDYVGRWPVLILSLGLLSPIHWLFLHSTGLLQVSLIGLMGILIGSSFPVSIVMAQEAWPRGVGLASAMVMGLGWAPGGLGASITGLIADRTSLAAGLQALSLPPLLGVICALVYLGWQRYYSHPEKLLPDL